MLDLFWNYFIHFFAAALAIFSAIGAIMLPVTIGLKIADFFEKRKKKTEDLAETEE